MTIKINAKERANGRWIVTNEFGEIEGFYNSEKEAVEKANKLQKELESRIEREN